MAGWNTLYSYTVEWKLGHTISHPLFPDIAEIHLDHHGMCSVSTGIDAVLKIDVNGALLELHAGADVLAAMKAELGVRVWPTLVPEDP